VEDRVEAHGSAAVDDVDLLDYAALMTLRQGGSVMVVDRAALRRSSGTERRSSEGMFDIGTPRRQRRRA
jgi:hypothetical protein